MIDIIAKTLLAASLAVLGAVAVLPPPAPIIATNYTEYLPPAEVVSQYSQAGHESVKPATEDNLENLKRLELQIKEQNAQAARISNKLDILLNAQGVSNANRREGRRER